MGPPFSKLIVSSFTILLVVAYNVSVSSCNATTTSLTPRVHVRVVNDLGDGLDLTIHCKSKDNDLGKQIVSFQEHYDFEFHMNVFGTTQFFCGMAWTGSFQWFDIYIQRRDEKICGEECVWSIRKTGPCVLNYNTLEDKCFEWNS
ncbi:hypothetical protein Dsin_007543 [Dipteronia sinensis]|uniref:S-protein homolog n=1 Tax=Dipteronia sinensis TaxID=43782 RepID=A0AAE0B0D2_9ROSI|nr:hypothetical protein Dsin_007543 [Dipteronia sinensis]